MSATLSKKGTFLFPGTKNGGSQVRRMGVEPYLISYAFDVVIVDVYF